LNKKFGKGLSFLLSLVFAFDKNHLTKQEALSSFLFISTIGMNNLKGLILKTQKITQIGRELGLWV